MESWNGQMMLDFYIHEYLTKNGMHESAERFSTEANFKPETFATKLPEGFLSDWWSIFWSRYTAKFPEHAVQDDGSGPSNSNPAMPGPDTNYMHQNMCPTMPLGFRNFPDPSIMQMQEYQNMMSGPVNGNLVVNGYSLNGTGYSQMAPMPENGNSLGTGYSQMLPPMPENGDFIGTGYSQMAPMPENRNCIRTGYSQMTLMPDNRNFIGTGYSQIAPMPENRNLLGTYNSLMVNRNFLRTDFSQIMTMPENGNLLETDFSRMRMPSPENGNLPGSDFSQMLPPLPENGNLIRSDFSQMLPPMSENGNLIRSDYSQMVPPMPENGTFLDTDLSRTRMTRPENGNLLGSEFPRVMPRPENGSFHINDIPTTTSNSPLPSSSNPSSGEKVYKNPQLFITRDDKQGSNCPRSTAATAAAGPSNPSAKPHELKLKSPETDSRSPALFNSQLNDPRLVPTSINSGHSPQEKVQKKAHQLSLKSDAKSGSRFCSSAAEASHFLPQASPGRMLAAGTDARLGLPTIDPPTKLLPSGSNFSGPKKNKKQLPIPAPGVKRYGVGLKKSTSAAEPAQLVPQAPKEEPAADGADARTNEQRCIGLPPGMELDSNPQPNSEDFTRVDGSGCNLKRSANAEPTPPAPKAAKKTNAEPDGAGSSTSSNSSSSGPNS